MDRRLFVTSVLLPAGLLAVTLGAANALPAAAPREDLVPADNGDVETVWWRRRWYGHRRWYGRRRWRRW
jgi:hypothetical protein